MEFVKICITQFFENDFRLCQPSKTKTINSVYNENKEKQDIFTIEMLKLANVLHANRLSK